MTDDYTYLSAKRFKGVTYDWNHLSNYGDGQKLYCLTDFQIGWLLSSTIYMSWKTRWENCPCSTSDLIAMQAELDLALMTCIDLQPWMLDFNYNQAVGATLDAYDTAYDLGGIPELNPETPTDFYSGDDSSERMLALCTACNIYVRTYATNWIAKAQVALGVVAVVGVFASITIVGGIIASVLVAGLVFITQVALDAMQDDTALDNVVCCMFNALIGAVTNETNFEESLDSCGFAGGSNEAIIRDIIASDLDQFNNWLSFLNSLGDSYILAQNGVTSCPCDIPLDITVTFDGSGYQAYTFIDGFNDGTFGNPLPSGRAVDIGGQKDQVRVRVDLTTDSNYVTVVEFDSYLTATFAGHNRKMDLYDIDDNLLQGWATSGGARNAWVHNENTFNQAGVAYIEFFAYRVAAAIDPIWADNLQIHYTED